MRYVIYGVSLVTVLGIQGCQDLTGNNLPTGIPDPATIRTAAGARGLAAMARQSFQKAIGSTILVGGLVSDELQATYRGGTGTVLRAGPDELVDSRHLGTKGDLNTTIAPYSNLHLVRRNASQAIEALARYASGTSSNLRGMLYASMAYAEVWLADMYCSGIPLSTLNYDGDWTFRPGSNTQDVYRHAVQLFDSAIALAADSVPVQHLAHIGKARALLALGEYAQLETVLQDVPNDFSYAEPIATCDATGTGCTVQQIISGIKFSLTISSREGGRQVIYPENPRTQGTLLNMPLFPEIYFPVYHPAQYAQAGISAIVIASGREAQLMRAEAALKANQPDRMIDILNALRAGDPRTSSLPSLSDPGPQTRLDTLFSERGQWLFLTGHRQGDLRRMIRNYDR